MNVFERDAQIFLKSRSQLNTIGIRSVTRHEIYTEDSQILGATIPNLVARAELVAGVCTFLVVDTFSLVADGENRQKEMNSGIGNDSVDCTKVERQATWAFRYNFSKVSDFNGIQLSDLGRNMKASYFSDTVAFTDISVECHNPKHSSSC
jgi:hypothetical protein